MEGSLESLRLVALCQPSGKVQYDSAQVTWHGREQMVTTPHIKPRSGS